MTIQIRVFDEYENADKVTESSSVSSFEEAQGEIEVLARHWLKREQDKRNVVPETGEETEETVDEIIGKGDEPASAPQE